MSLFHVRLLVRARSLRQDVARIARAKGNFPFGRPVVQSAIGMMTPLGLQNQIGIALTGIGSTHANLGIALLALLVVAAKGPLAAVFGLTRHFEIRRDGREGIESCRRQVLIDIQIARPSHDCLGCKAVVSLGLNGQPVDSFGRQVHGLRREGVSRASRQRQGRRRRKRSRRGTLPVLDCKRNKTRKSQKNIAAYINEQNTIISEIPLYLHFHETLIQCDLLWRH